MNAFELFAVLTLNKKDFDQGLQESEKEAQTFGSKLTRALGTAGKIGAAAIGAVAGGITAAGTAMVKAAGQTAAYGDNIDKMSQKMGISAQAYQEWDFIMQHSGTTIDGMQRGMATLNKAVEQGSEAFEQLGISQEELASMSTEEIFARTIEGLQGMAEGSERAVLAQELLGGAAKELGPLLNTTAEETEAMRQQVHDLGGVMSDEAVKAAAGYQDSLQNLQTAVGGIKAKLIGDFLPGITKVMDGLTAIFSGDNGGLAKIKEGVSSVIKSISDQLPKFVELGSSIITSLVTAISQNLPALLQSGTEMVLETVRGVIDNLPAVLAAGVEALLTLVEGISKSIPELIPAAIAAVVQLVTTLTEPASLERLIQAALELIVALAIGLVKAIPELIRQAPVIISHIVQALVAEIPQLIGAALELIIALGSGLVEAIPELLVSVGEVILGMVGGFINGVHDFIDVGRQFVEGLWNGIAGAWDWVVSKVTSLFSGLIGSVKGVLGIRSPSKVARDQIGKMFGEGVALGIMDSIGDIRSASDAVSDAMLGISTPTLSGSNYKRPATSTYTASAVSSPNIIIEFTGDLAQLGRVLEPVIVSESARKGADLVTA